MSVHAINKNATERPTASIIYIDPPMARRVLEKNTRNRPISEAHVQRLMEEMSSGRWQYNGEAIKWSIDNVILDGQHRLTALARLDDTVSFPFLVVRGLATESQDTMDQGRTRSAGDQLNLDGLIANGADSKVIAGAIRVYVQWTNGGLFGDAKVHRISNTEVVSWAKDHPIEMSMMGDLLSDRLRRVKARPSLTLAVMLHLHLLDGEAARDFAAGLYSGAGLEAGNPILTLRDRLDHIRVQNLKVPDRDIIAFFIVAWNAWREGRSMQKLQRPRSGSWAVDNFPVAR